MQTSFAEVTSDSKSAVMLGLLQQYWQANAFRALQQEAVSATLKKEDTILILPTGTCELEAQQSSGSALLMFCTI